jgi:threonine dehydrogenase-like Zn-dependent dehydrogenase
VKGLFFHGAHDIRYETLPDPKVSDPGDVLVRTIGCSICGSDLHYYKGDFKGQCGFSIGHEAIGEVMEVGSAVRTLKPGDEVIVSAAIGCGRCAACLARNVMSCESFDRVQTYGIGDGYEGSQAEAFVVPWGDTNAIKVPEGVSHEQALMLTDMVPTAWLGVRNADVRPGETVVVVGLGPIGLTAVELAYLFGASQVIGVGRLREDRMAIGRELGAITVKPDEALETIRELTNGRMAHSVVETAGSESSILLAMNAVRRNGVVSMVGANTDPVFPFPMGLALGRNIVFKPALCSSMQYWDQAVPLVQSGKLRPERLVSDRIRLSEGPDAYRRMADGAPGVLKTMMAP